MSKKNKFGKKIPDSAHEARLYSERRRLDEISGGDHTLDLIMNTAIEGDAELLGFLARNFGINYVEGGKHALFWVAGSNDLEAAELLISAGSTVHNAGKKAASPLMHAAYRNQLDMAKLLVKHGARVHYADGNGDTALSFALEQGHEEMAAYLRSLMEG